jgi:GGDEF domain-containing protein
LKNKLKKITNLTVNELLSNEIILPSNYLEKFNYYAKELEINLDDNEFKEEINKVILKDFKTIEEYMKLIMSSTSTLKKNISNATDAILNNDNDALSSIYKKMIRLEKELIELNEKLFVDEITNTFNRKWIYTKFLNEDAEFKENGICVLIDVSDYIYVQKEYGELLANNLLIFATKFINQKLNEEKLKYKMVRYHENKFLIFILNTNKQEKNIINFILNFEKLLSHTTLKSNSGLYIKATYKFGIAEFKSNQDSREVFEKLLTQEKQE